MASNSFGTVFRITTWGESHGKAIGVVIDGCPAGLPLSEADIQPDLDRRAPGNSPYTSPRTETDRVEIWSGIFEGVTTGAPISLIIPNRSYDSAPYEGIVRLLRPGHANFTYFTKYGVFDHRGGGRSSGRETACRVAAGAIAKKILSMFSVTVIAYFREMESIRCKEPSFEDLASLRNAIAKSPVFCPDTEAERYFLKRIEEEKSQGDSLGGIVECRVLGLPPGLGDPVYEKLEANLSKGILSIPATKGIEFGQGFAAAEMKGSEHNDPFTTIGEGKFITETNHSGGILGGISNGMPLVFRTVFKPPSSIRKAQKTVCYEGKEGKLSIPSSGKHDPCIAIRGVPVVEAMTALVLVDAFLLQQTTRLESFPGISSMI